MTEYFGPIAVAIKKLKDIKNFTIELKSIVKFNKEKCLILNCNIDSVDRCFDFDACIPFDDFLSCPQPIDDGPSNLKAFLGKSPYEEIIVARVAYRLVEAQKEARERIRI